MAEDGRIRSVAIIGAGAAGESPFLPRLGRWAVLIFLS
jgi:hypothetical protein